MNKIIAPVDFSDVSINAARYAANLAGYLNMPLVLLHVIPIPLSYPDVIPVDFPVVPDMEDAESSLGKLAGELEKELLHQVDIETVTRTGSILHEITSYCNRIKPYAVVSGTHVMPAFTRFLKGKITLGLLHQCTSPVIVVPIDYSFRKPVQIGLASDFQHVIECTPTPVIKSIVEDLGAKLEILHVDHDFHEEENIEKGSKQISRLFAEQRPKIRILKSAFTEDTILNYASERKLDLLIVIPKKHHWIDLLIRHQHTNNIALHAPVPVMVVKNAI